MAEKSEPIDKAKLAKLLGLAFELHTKQGAILEELNEILSGKAGIVLALKEFESYFDTLWCHRYANGLHGRYIWRYVQDRPNLKRLIKQLGLEELKGRALAYLRSEDPFVVKARHPFGLFVSGINSYTAPADPQDLELDAEAPADCRHKPRCATDALCTIKRNREMRG